MTQRVFSDTDRLYFMHIPKTAGTSLKKMLRSYFAEGEFCTAIYYSELVDVPVDRLREYRGFAGHFNYSFHRLFDEPLRMVTFLRDPVKHVVSHAGYMRFNKGHPYFPKAKSMSLAQILRDDLFRRSLDNHQTRLLALDMNPAPVLEQARIQRQTSFTAVESAMWSVAPAISDSETVALAKAHLDRFDFVGLTGRFAESIYVLCTSLGWELPAVYPVANIGAKFSEDELTDETRSLIQDLVKLDTQVYEHAQEIFKRQLQEHPVDVVAMNKYLIDQLVLVNRDRDRLYAQSPRRVWNGVRGVWHRVRQRWNALRGVLEKTDAHR